ncbi:MAG TPA: hypothetical protein VM534_10895 [Thermoanaerobaculia bacterium]|nr:hypothetical protein [Thermoanaerobaculia bacterium]
MLQVVGMIILPIALYMGLVRDQIQIEVRLLAIGGVVFLLGWLMAKETSK